VVVPDEANDRVAISNNEQDLDVRVVYPDESVVVENDAAAGLKGGIAMAAKTNSVELRLVSEILPPVVEGEVVQATSVSLTRGLWAIVSYNMRGAPRLGAIDWVTRWTSGRPILTSAALFNDSDISAVATDGNYVFAAQATGAEEFPFPAVVERLRVWNNKCTLDDNMRVPLTSFVATSVTPAENEVYTTSGDGGEVAAFDKATLEPLGAFPLDDARWVAWDEAGGRVIVVQGTPGRISVFAEGEFPGGSMNLLNTFPFPGADVPESKSTADIAGGKAFIAAGPEGVQIMCLDDGQIVGSVPRPDPAGLGLDPAVVVTNAVTVDGDLMFISNGEAGVYVATGENDFDETACAAPQEITMLGRLRFDDLQSANHVAYRSNHLFVAAGLGGVKVVRVKVR